jgi:RNA polymerase sigma factor (sigma-70 family)
MFSAMTATNPPDTELFRRFVRSRDEHAFAQLVANYIDLVYSTCLRRVRGDTHLAEDITQSVFLCLARKAARLPCEVILAGWLYQTARYLSNDAMKMRNRRQQHEQRAAAEMAARSTTQTADAAWSQLSPVLESAMDRMSPRDRDVLLLRYFQSLDVSEIATRTGVPANTASHRIARALDKLRSHLAARGVTAPADVLGAAITAGAIQHAPAGLASTATAQMTAAAMTPASLALAHASAVVATLKVAAVVILSVVGFTVAVQALRLTTAQTPPTGAVSPPTPSTAPTAVADGQPLEPISPEQTQQIRTAVYTLSHYQLFVQYNEWPKAIRTLVMIGRPAVPELVALLDRTDNDSTLRAMGFTLRAIGDARACPALIRALARTSVLSSDCGFDVNDRELAAFMQLHQLGLTNADFADFLKAHNIGPGPGAEAAAVAWKLSQAGDGRVMYGRAIREIAGALETITHHSEGKAGNIDAKNDTPAALEAARAKHAQLSKQWQTWWDRHKNDFVTDAEMASLTAHAHDSADVETAGIAVFGPLFPTGKPYYLGPVHDVRLRGVDERQDQDDIIDFDSDRVMSLLDAMRYAPPGTKEFTSTNVNLWSSSEGAGADANCQHTYYGGTIKGFVMTGGREMYKLSARDDLVWPVDDGRWDTLESEIESGQPIALDPLGPYGEFDYRDPITHQSNGEHLPATFLFRTREGGAGIVQVLDSDVEHKAVHIRYQMVQPHPKHFEPRAMQPLPPAPPFGPVKEVTLSPVAPGNVCAMDLNTGQMITAPADLKLEKYGYSQDFLRDYPAAVVPGRWSDELHRPEPAGVMLSHLTLVPLSDDAFDKLEPGMALLALQHSSPHDFASLNLETYTAATAVFRTAEGTSGMMQVTGTTKSPPTITFRYKLLPTASTQPARQQ